MSTVADTRWANSSFRRFVFLLSQFKIEKRDLVLTGKAVWLIGREKTKSGPDKGKMVPSINRKIDLDKIAKVRNSVFFQISIF